MKYALVGYGKMGREIDAQAAGRGHLRTAALDLADLSGARIEPGMLGGAEVAFEFTTPAAALENVRALVEAGLAVVCGTTGWAPDDRLREAIREAGAGVVVAPNFSVGMNLFYRVATEAGRLFGGAALHDPYLVEVHHSAKQDAPSGTARRLADLLVASDPRLGEWQDGPADGPARPGVLPVTSVRAGAEPGRHTVVWDGPFERIVLEHGARSRSGFALGAVLAGERVIGRSGWCSFDELIDEILAERLEKRPGGAG